MLPSVTLSLDVIYSLCYLFSAQTNSKCSAADTDIISGYSLKNIIQNMELLEDKTHLPQNDVHIAVEKRETRQTHPEAKGQYKDDQKV